jgi:flagellar hook assembly protein FlgD
VRHISTRISEPVEWTYHWDGKDTRGNTLAKGIYFVRIETGGGVISRKLLYLD